MKYTDAELSSDIDKIKQIPIVSTMLEVICRTTEMGFAAIARVTQERWIACSVRDEIFFGLEAGGELEIETTICNDIRNIKKAVIIDDVSRDEIYCNHHTPALYGFQSYISVPIILKNGEFFGTICAIDPKPAQINNAKIIGMFNLFADLISFHLHSISLIERSNDAVQELNRKLTDSIDENRQYQYISNHNLQEPLRKIRVFSDMLVSSAENKDVEKTKDLALKINSSAQKFSMMVKDLSEFSELNSEVIFETVDLNKIVADVCVQLEQQLRIKKAVVKISLLPSVEAIPLQMEQLFYHLINNAIRFSKKDTSLIIQISASEPSQGQISNLLPKKQGKKFVEILIQDNGIGIEKYQLEKIFDIFTWLPYDQIPDGGGVGLAYCRKIIRKHGGSITAESEPGYNTTFSIILPVNQNSVHDLVFNERIF